MLQQTIKIVDVIFTKELDKKQQRRQNFDKELCAVKRSEQSSAKSVFIALL